ncbi:hypothetical protein MBLNU230_g1968t1 [Neophaeotheca triangularis]
MNENSSSRNGPVEEGGAADMTPKMTGTATTSSTSGSLTSATDDLPGEVVNNNVNVGGSSSSSRRMSTSTNATSLLNVTTSRQKNGALSTSASESLSHSSNHSSSNNSNSAASSMTSPPPPPPQPASPGQPPSANGSTTPSATTGSSSTTAGREGRTVRGRTPGNSRRVSTSGHQSGLNSASPSADRSSLETKNPNRIGTIGICALDSKARSKPSRNILNKLVGKDNEFDVIIFGDKIILDESVENWPICDFLISFFSDGFPLEKAIAYAKLRQPYCVNDLPLQTILWDRRLCLKVLDKLNVPTPARLEVNRDGGPVILTTDIAQRMYELNGVQLYGSDDGRGGGQTPPMDVHMEDDDDTLVVDGKRLSKPFVEKPVSGEDHNINIYYPKSQGGGGRRLFRKINNKSSEKDEKLTTPSAITEKGSSYIYERFLKVENAEDVKAYTVGPDYCHAETRKSPVVDGVVKRNPNGKEIRYVTNLTKEEAGMAARIAEGFGQRVCGFDLLRVDKESYVIDVNGWSFVKDNNDYYEKAASVLRSMFIRERLRWEGKATTASDTDGSEYSGKGAVAQPDPEKGIQRKSTFGRDREAGVHRSSTLKSVFGARSISQLRDSVQPGHQKQGKNEATSGATSPLTSPSTLERPTGTLPGRQIPPTKDQAESILPPPAVPASANLSSAVEDQPALSVSSSASAENLTLPGPAANGQPPANVPAPASKSQWKLKGMVSVVRHADRTPKQKFKFTFHTKPFVDLLKGHQEEVLLVGEAALNTVQQAVAQAMNEGEEDMSKLRTLGNALAKKGGWPGTKVQIKPMFKKPKDKDGKKNGKEEKAKLKDDLLKHEEAAATPTTDENTAVDPSQKREQKRSDSISEVTLSRAAAAENNLVLDKLQLVMKWGGEPTHSARYQAADLGENYRNDLLLMNRDALSDVSIFTSSERRVTTSAQIFAAAFLDQKEVEPDQIKVRKDLLDDSNAAKDEMDKVKKRLKGLLRQGTAAPEQFAWPKDGTPEPFVVARDVVELMKFHRRVMRNNFSRLQGSSEAVSSLEKLQKNGESSSASSVDKGAAPSSPQLAQANTVQARWCAGEDADLFKERWEKLFDEFTDAEKVDPSKISELYDTMKFDALHNRQFLEWVFTPTQSMMAEEESRQREEANGATLERTASQDARAEFEETHVGHQPATDGKGAGETGAQAKPSETKTSQDGVSPAPSQTQKHQPTLASRMGFRRKSQDLLSASNSRAPTAAADDPAQSYFSLFTGNHNTSTTPNSNTASNNPENPSHPSSSKAKSDLRLSKLRELYRLSKILFDFIGPQEYGITNSEKLEIGLLTSLPLLKEIVSDLEEMQASDDAKSFIYFTKESHVYTLLNCILEGGITTKIARNAIPELDYLSQINFELYESANTPHQHASTPSTTLSSPIPSTTPTATTTNPTQPKSQQTNPSLDPYNYSIRITISPGCHTFDPLDVQLDSKHCIGCAPRRSLTAHGDWKEVLETLKGRFGTVKLPKSFLAVNLSEKLNLGGAAAEEGNNEGVEGVEDAGKGGSGEGKGERDTMGGVGDAEAKTAEAAAEAVADGRGEEKVAVPGGEGLIGGSEEEIAERRGSV